MQKYINSNDADSFRQFSNAFESILLEHLNQDFECIVFVCIGSDRSTGDSLGPLTGYKLSTLRYPNIHVYGDLDSPVHAKNLEETLHRINSIHRKPLIVAIDACLGLMDHVGYITIKKGALKPGAGVNKTLPEVGNISIAGIVNFGGMMDFIILQNTRLSTVMKMADLISLGIKYILWKSKDYILSTGSKQSINTLEENLMQ